MTGKYQRLFKLEEAFEIVLDFMQLSKNILKKILKETKSSDGLLYWYDEIQNEYKLKTLIGIPADKISFITTMLRQPNGLIDRIKTKSEGFLVPDIANDKNLANLTGITNFAKAYRSMLVSPLKFKHKTYGMVVLFKTEQAFKLKDLKLLQLFAPRAALQLDHARLYQLTKETALENARLYFNFSKLYHQATLDELTGLYNRNFLIQRIKEEVKKAWRFKQSLSVIFTDLDYFKIINDQYGHQIGDQLLTEFGDLIKGSIREYDIACRFGGEEFVILLPNTELANAAELAERLRLKITKFQFCVPKNLKITASFGVSSTPEFPDNPVQLNDAALNEYTEKIIEWADEAVYAAKKAGRNQVKVYQKES